MKTLMTIKTLIKSIVAGVNLILHNSKGLCINSSLTPQKLAYHFFFPSGFRGRLVGPSFKDISFILIGRKSLLSTQGVASSVSSLSGKLL